MKDVFVIKLNCGLYLYSVDEDNSDCIYGTYSTYAHVFNTAEEVDEIVDKYNIEGYSLTTK